MVTMAHQKPSNAPKTTAADIKARAARGYDCVPRPLWLLALANSPSDIAKVWSMKRLSAGCDLELANGTRNFGHFLKGPPKLLGQPSCLPFGVLKTFFWSQSLCDAQHHPCSHLKAFYLTYCARIVHQLLCLVRFKKHNSAGLSRA
jgi:hypothetical protein